MHIKTKLKHIEFIVVDPSDSPPASKVANCIKSEFDNKEVLDKLIKYLSNYVLTEIVTTCVFVNS